MAQTAQQDLNVFDITSRYKFPSGDGAGHTVGIVALDAGYDPKQTERYFQSRNLPQPVVEVVSVDGANDLPSESDFTAPMSVEIVGSIVPQAKLIVYQGKATEKGFVDTLVTAARDDVRRPSVLLIGYGGPETAVAAAATATVDAAFNYAASRGTTVICSGGDRPDDDVPSFPASSPLVLAVGGTNLNGGEVTSSAPNTGEIVWSDANSRTGSFGGQSPRYPRPPWQAGLTARRITGEVEELTSRGLPDVAAFAAPRLIFDLNASEVVLGGTVAAAAIWAGLITLLDQNLGGMIGLLAPLLYADRRGLTSITAGDNGLYVATEGWNACTGLGTPIGDQLLELLRGQKLPLPVTAPDLTPEPISLRRTGYSADDLAGDDALGFSEDAEVLATLIAAADVKPPLSIGLFGSWGSGKSFFMRMLEQRIDRLAEGTRTAGPDRHSDYCPEVVQISFNAWNYIEGNVWAGLVARVWEALHEHYVKRLGNDKRYQSLVANLAGYESIATLRRRELEAKTRATEKTQQQLQEAESTTVGSLAAKSDAHALSSATDKLIATVGSDVAAEKIDELRSDFNDLRTVAGRVGGGWTKLQGPSAGRVKLLAALLGLVILAVGSVAIFVINQPVGSAVVGILTVTAAILAPSTALAEVAAGAMAAVLERPEVKRHEQEIAELKSKLDDAEAHVVQARARVAEITGTDGVYSLVEERYLSSEYREQLGIVGLVQRDMEKLSRQLLPPEPSAARHEVDPDRIVLYVDDLDRCSPALVTQVLEAIHLLLTFPLFVVVVGVDVRWLSRALETQHKDMFGKGEGGDQPTASSQDYLEKLFQVALWLRPMEEPAFARLVADLTEPKPTPGSGAGGDAVVSPSVVIGDASGSGTSPPAQQGDKSSPPAPSIARPDELIATALSFSEGERQYLAQLAPLISTPRVAKRLVNTYRLVRARLDDAIAQSSHREVLVLLAIVSGFPREAVQLLETLEADRSTTWSELFERLQPQNVATKTGWCSAALGDLSEAEAEQWSSLNSRLKRVPLPSEELDRYRPWIQLAWRHSFIPRPKRDSRAIPDEAKPNR